MQKNLLQLIGQMAIELATHGKNLLQLIGQMAIELATHGFATGTKISEASFLVVTYSLVSTVSN